MIYTYQDALNHGFDYLGGRGDKDRQDSLRAVQAAYSELSNLRRWHFYTDQFRITTVANYSTGTVEYRHTGGANERMLTLTTGTWPTWAAYGTVIISNVQYQVERRISNSIVTLTEASNPGGDVASDTTYNLYRAIYPLPEDFSSTDEIASLGSAACWPEYIPTSEWLLPQYRSQSPGTPRFFTVLGDPNLLDSMAIAFCPPPSQAISFDGVYQRRPRKLITPEYKTGTVTVSAASPTITGSSAVFTSRMAGAVIRLSDNATNYPTGLTGLHPADQERIVQSFTSATVMTADADFDAAATAVKYVISDPVDIESGSMLTAFECGIEVNLARMRRMRDLRMATENYERAKLIAMEADSKSSAPQYAKAGGARRRFGLRDLSVIGEDQ